MVVSVDPEIDSDIPAMLGASAALVLSGVPLPVRLVRHALGYVNGVYVLNPTKAELAKSQLDLVVAGTSKAVLMVESEADILSEEVMLGAVVYGHDQMQVAINAINEFATKSTRKFGIGKLLKPMKNWLPKYAKLPAKPLKKRSKSVKNKRVLPNWTSWSAVKEALITEETDTLAANEIKDIFKHLEADVVRSQILDGQPRIDGRDTRTVRPLNIQTGVLPRTHGSALFTRGETQALAVATFGYFTRRSKLLMRCPANTPTASCCTTTSLHTLPAKWVA